MQAYPGQVNSRLRCRETRNSSTCGNPWFFALIDDMLTLDPGLLRYFFVGNHELVVVVAWLFRGFRGSLPRECK